MSYSQSDFHWIGTPIPKLPVPFVTGPEVDDAWRKTQISLSTVTPILLAGPAGTGKTTFMAYIARGLQQNTNSAISYLTRMQWLENEVWWTTASGYIDDVHTGRSYARKYQGEWGDNYDAAGLARHAKYLFIDDLGTEPSDVAGNLDIMVRLIEDRQRDEKLTWFTTNLDSKQISNRYGQRFFSRLKTMAVPILVRGTDRRQQRAIESQP